MGKKFIIVLEEVESLPPNTGAQPGFYYARQGSYSFLKFIPEDFRIKPSCMELDSEQLDKLMMRGLREGEILGTYNYVGPELKEQPRQQSNIDIPVMEWVSADTLIKVVELLAKK